MKKLLLTLGLLFASHLSFAACTSTSYSNGWTCVQQKVQANAGAGATAVATFGGNTSNGNMVVVFSEVCNDVGCSTDTTPITLAVTDGTGDSPVSASINPCRLDTNHKTVYAWVFPTVGATTTFTVTATGGTPFYLASVASEWIGGATSSPFDVVACGNNNVAGTTGSLAAGTTTNATDLVIGHIELGAANAVTPGAGFTEIGEDVTGIEHEALSVIATGTQTCTWSFGSATYEAMCATIKAVTVAGNPSRTLRVTND